MSFADLSSAGLSSPQYYATPGPLTDLSAHAESLRDLPQDVASIVCAVQGNLIHIFWAQRYGVPLSDARKGEVQIRRPSTMLNVIFERDPRPFSEAREPAARLVGNCRDFTTLTVALLRARGIPARARCGFATYFVPDHYEDHWIVEVWNAAKQCWVMVDAQLDAFQCEALGVTFDPLDMPQGQFIPAGRAWDMVHFEEADPDKFGIFDMKGVWFIRGNLLRDMAALNKIETLPWDSWGLAGDEAVAAAHRDLLDEAARLTQGDDSLFDEMRTLYESYEGLRVPRLIYSYVAGPEPQEQDILADEVFAAPSL